MATRDDGENLLHGPRRERQRSYKEVEHAPALAPVDGMELKDNPSSYAIEEGQSSRLKHHQKDPEDDEVGVDEDSNKCAAVAHAHTVLREHDEIDEYSRNTRDDASKAAQESENTHRCWTVRNPLLEVAR